MQQDPDPEPEPLMQQDPEPEPEAAPEPLMRQDPEPEPMTAMGAVMEPAKPLRRPVDELIKALMDKLQQRQAQVASQQDKKLLA